MISKTVTGTLFVGESADENDLYSNDTDLYTHAVFVTDSDISFIFSSGIGGYFNVPESDFVDEDGDTTFYPNCNETVIEIGHPIDTTTLEKYAESVQLRYVTIDGEAFVRARNDITAYSPNYLFIDGVLYEHGQMFMQSQTPSNEDPFLGIESVEHPVYVENVETGFRVPVEQEKIQTLIENSELNGAVKVDREVTVEL